MVAGLKAIVLGGSYASGGARPDSDLDPGLYYHEDQPLDIAHLCAIASRINDTANPTVTGLGGWGTWVNGGVWLSIGGQRVDWLYRNLNFVRATLAACNTGQIRSDYWQQPAYGFHSYMYCRETAICRPLYDPEGLIERLKTQVAHYSPQLKQAIVTRFLWQARFTLDNTAKPAARGEVYLVTGCLARARHCLVQVLYALNETYYLSEKRLAADCRIFRLQPQGFVERLSLILGETGTTNAQLEESLRQTEVFYCEVATLAAEKRENRLHMTPSPSGATSRR